MIESSEGVPPHIALLLNEQFDFGNPRRVAKKLREMIRDLRDQASSSKVELLGDLGDDPGIFRAVLSGGLDLFVGHGACQAPSCRISYANQLSRSIALMADQVTMHDYFRERIQGLRTRATNADLMGLVGDLYVLQVLRPLVKAGILRFISPIVPLCSSCMTEFEARVHAITSDVMSNFSDGWSIERLDDEITVDSGNTYQPHLVTRVSPEFAKGKDDQELLEIVVGTAVRSALWDARDASLVSGAVFSNSSAGLNALLSEDGRSMVSSDFRAFAAQRAAELPWVDGLSIQQTIHLREEASSALPALREFLARRLAARPLSESTFDWDSCVAELREQAQDVRSELKIATSRSASLKRGAAGILGLGISAVSFAAEGPVAGLGGVLGTLGLIHSLPAPDGLHTQSLRAKPGYVLVAAQDILNHAN